MTSLFRGSAAILSVSLLSLAACSSSSSGDTSPATPASTSSSSPAPTTTPSPQKPPASTDAGSDAGADAATSDAAATSSTLRLVVPADFKGTTSKLVVALEPSLPPAGPPAGVVYQESNPAVIAGQTLVLDADASVANGDYYLLAVLYMQGGGQFAPKSGVDYEATSATKVHFDGAQHDLGTLTLSVAP